ncbi:MAG TPA: hypothetical protein VFA44_04770 [Gaiellaceae bacterium]|nr:hypothetical protein [Gaiellaceae bacterium]
MALAPTGLVADLGGYGYAVYPCVLFLLFFVRVSVPRAAFGWALAAAAAFALGALAASDAVLGAALAGGFLALVVLAALAGSRR